MLLPTTPTLDAESAAAIGSAMSRLFTRIATDRIFASQFASAANARDSFALRTLVGQTGVQFKSASTASAPAGSTVVTITITVCYKGNCWDVIVTVTYTPP